MGPGPDDRRSGGRRRLRLAHHSVPHRRERGPDRLLPWRCCSRGSRRNASTLYSRPSTGTMQTSGSRLPSSDSTVRSRLPRVTFAAVRRAVIDLLHTAGSRTLTDVWTPLMTAAQVEADRTDRADAGTDTATAEALQALRSMADDLPRNNDYSQARHLQVLADLSRAEGSDTVDTWRAVVHAWRPMGPCTTLAGPNFTWPGPLSGPDSVVMPSIRWLTRPRSRAPWERDVCGTPSWTWHAGHGSRSTWETAAGPGLLAWRG